MEQLLLLQLLRNVRGIHQHAHKNGEKKKNQECTEQTIIIFIHGDMLDDVKLQQELWYTKRRKRVTFQYKPRNQPISTDYPKNDERDTSLGTSWPSPSAFSSFLFIHLSGFLSEGPRRRSLHDGLQLLVLF